MFDWEDEVKKTDAALAEAAKGTGGRLDVDAPIRNVEGDARIERPERPADLTDKITDESSYDPSIAFIFRTVFKVTFFRNFENDLYRNLENRPHELISFESETCGIINTFST